MSEKVQKDDALFEQLGKSKKKKKHKIIRTVLILIVVVAIVLTAGVSILQRQVREQFASAAGEVRSATAETGTISTVVSGSGILTNVDTETVSIPSGVEIKEILVEYGDSVAENDLLATVDLATVRSAMATLQSEIEELDEQISDAEGDKVSSYVRAGVTGRVKIIHAEENMDVATVMVENGALAVISLDGYMAVDLDAENVSAGDTVTVFCGEDEYEGTVERVIGTTATILVTDNGPKYDEEVTVQAEDGSQIGTGKLYIHNPLAVTGYAGTINRVSVKENQKVYESSSLFYLQDTSYSANYDSLLRTRGEKEETLLELLKLQRYGGLTAPISGSVFSVADLDSEEEILDIVTLSPDVSMSVTISVDESDILSLALDQQADITVSSVSEETFTGIVTEIDKTAADGSYTAVITLDKITGMLPGMTASVDVRIEGVDNTIIIPVDALHQTSTGAYVYTSYDEETQEYGGRVDVVAGLSNSNYVEIKSGLNEGDTVYYTESESIFDMFSGMGGFGGGNRGGQSGGEMPDFGGASPAMPAGGSMPEGGGMPGGRG